MNYFAELKRRNIFKVAAAYLALGWVVIQITDVVVPALNLPNSLNSIVVYIGLIGFPFALFFTWAFELTPDGIKKTAEVDVEDSIRSTTGQKINYAIIGLLAIAVAFLLIDRNSSPEIAAGERSIAVMPFADMSADGSQEYFGDGIAEEILNALVTIEELDVTSRTSSFAYKGTNTQIPEIANELDVNYVLEGSVRTDGENVRVTAQLIDVAADRHLWSDTFDRELINIFAIQDEISQKVAQALKIKLVGENELVEPPTENIDAYDLILRARQMLYVPNLERSIEARKLIEKALEIDPEYADGWAMLSRSYDLTIFWGSNGDYDDTEIANMFTLALDAANKGISINPNHSESWNNRGHTQLHLNQWMDARISSEQAISLNERSSSNWHRIGEYYSAIGQIDEAVNALKVASDIAPTNAAIVNRYGRALLMAGQYDRAREELTKASDLGFGLANNARAIISIIEKDISDAMVDMEIYSRAQEGPLDENFANYIEAYYANNSSADYHYQLPNPASNYVAKDVSGMLISDGDYLVTLMRNGQENVYSSLTSLYFPPFRNILNQPVMKKYLKEIGLTNHWRSISFPSFCRPIGEDDFECQDGEGNWP